MNDKGRNILLLLTDYYPFGTGEAFLEPELPFLKGFDRVIIFPCNRPKTAKVRPLPDNAAVAGVQKGSSKKPVLPVNALRLCREILWLLKHKRLTYPILGIMMTFYHRALSEAAWVIEELEKLNVRKNDRIVCYSYWMNAGALAVLMVKGTYPKAICVCRCHRVDLYEEKNDYGYLPFRRSLLDAMDYICPIASKGKHYLMKKYGSCKGKLGVYRLGTIKPTCTSDNDCVTDRTVLRIVSCSAIIPFKRVYRIVQVLSRIGDIPIEWTHFGGGAQLGQVQKMSEMKLTGTITYDIRGNVPNSEVREAYGKNHYHLFLHASESEGIPVAIMEAMSFGIPAIATDVGGVSELVRHEKNGFLLHKDFQDEEMVVLIRRIWAMRDEEYLRLRQNAGAFWEKYYNAETNYPKFVKNILMGDTAERGYKICLNQNTKASASLLKI